MNPCLLCGSRRSSAVHRGSDRLYHTTGDAFTVVRCNDCGLLRLDPAPAPEELHRYYPANYWFSPDEDAAGRLEEAYRRVVLRDHVRFVEQALRRSTARGPVLDVGCGGGLLLGMLRERGHRVVGLDFSRDAASVAWRRRQVPAVNAKVTAAPFPPASFAAVTLFHVVEHLPDPRTDLAAARDLLQPDGRLIVQVPNAASWQYALFRGAWNGLDIPRHLFDFRASDLERLLHSCGFQILRRKHFSLRDNPAGFASSLAPSLDPMARRVRRLPESTPAKIAKDLLYLAILGTAIPFTLAEAAARSGSSIMLEARKQT